MMIRGKLFFLRWDFFSFLACGVVALAVVSNSAFSGAAPVITNVENDTIVVSSTINLKGTGCPEDEVVKLEMNGATFGSTVTDNQWTIQQLRLRVGPNLIEVRCGNDKTSLV